MKPTLLIMAAGMGSRYGSLKQMDGIGPNGEAIIDYSIYDAIRAGFGKIVFIIRKSFAEPFKAHFKAEKFGGDVEFEFVYQELDAIPEGFSVPEGRERPWGTGHAVMMGSGVIDTPFAVINSDDFYGREAFETLAGYFSENASAQGRYAIVAYHIKNTLSDNGEVNRGVCSITPDGYMADVTERFGIKYEDGCLVYKQDGEKVPLSEDSFVSMNFWGFTPDFFQVAQPLFKEFMAKKGGEQKSEFLITEVVDAAVNCHGAKVKMLECNAKWFGITYKEDRPAVVERIKSLIASGEYPEKLWINS